MRKLSKKFDSGALFGKRTMIQISYFEIARNLGVSKRSAKRYIKRDIENGFIEKKETEYKCQKYKTLLCGRNIYTLTKKGKAFLNISKRGDGGLKNGRLSPQSFNIRNSSKEEFAKGKASCLSFFEKEKKKLFEKLDFLHLLPKAPNWWFRNLKILKKTLSLLRWKKKKGYRVRHEERWVSTVLKDRGCGFRRKTAKRTSLILANNRKEMWRLTENASPRVMAVYDSLKKLKKRGLKTSFDEMQVLLRKGFAHLAICTSVTMKVLKESAIQNLNAFLNWVVALKDPQMVFSKNRDFEGVSLYVDRIFLRHKKQKSCRVRFVKSFFLENKERFLFLSAKDVFPKRSNAQNKIPICFLVHKTDPEKSHIIFQRNGTFKETLFVSDPEFKKKFLNVFA